MNELASCIVTFPRGAQVEMASEDVLMFYVLTISQREAIKSPGTMILCEESVASWKDVMNQVAIDKNGNILQIIAHVFRHADMHMKHKAHYDGLESMVSVHMFTFSPEGRANLYASVGMASQ